MAETVKKVKAPAKVKSATKTEADAPAAQAAKVKKGASSAKPRTKTVKSAEVTEKISAPAAGPRSVPAKPKAAQTEKPSAAPSRDEIAQLAHRFWKERGGHHGSHEQDWLRAERELRGKAS